MRTIVLAGGFATRLLPITLERPKPLLPIDGKPIIDYVLDQQRLPQPVVVSTNERFAPQFEEWRRKGNRDVELVVEGTACENEKLGTIGAIGYVIEQCAIDDDVLVIAGDNLFGFEIADFVSHYQGRVLIALHDLKDSELVRGRYGVAIVEEGVVTGFQEKPQKPRSTLASTACYIYPRDVLSRFTEFDSRSGRGRDAPGYFNEWGLTKHEWQIDAYVFESHWFDVGDRLSYLAANRFYSNQDTWCGEGISVDGSSVEDCILLGNTRISGCTLRGCIVDTDCQLEDISLRDCLVGQGTNLVGPGALGRERTCNVTDDPEGGTR